MPTLNKSIEPRGDTEGLLECVRELLQQKGLLQCREYPDPNIYSVLEQGWKSPRLEGSKQGVVEGISPGYTSCRDWELRFTGQKWLCSSKVGRQLLQPACGWGV